MWAPLLSFPLDPGFLPQLRRWGVVLEKPGAIPLAELNSRGLMWPQELAAKLPYSCKVCH